MNLKLEYWRERFLYPFALDTAPMKMQGGEISQMERDD